MPDLSLYDALYLALTLRDRLKGYDLHLAKGIVEGLESYLHLDSEKIEESRAELASGGGHDLEDVMRGLDCHHECSEEDLEPPDEAVVDTYQHYQRTVLSGQDGERFLELLENPPEPNEALKEAFELHRKLVVPPDDEGQIKRKPLMDAEEAVSWLKPEHFEKMLRERDEKSFREQVLAQWNAPADQFFKVIRDATVRHEDAVVDGGKVFEGKGSLVGPGEYAIDGDKPRQDQRRPEMSIEPKPPAELPELPEGWLVVFNSLYDDDMPGEDALFIQGPGGWRIDVDRYWMPTLYDRARAFDVRLTREGLGYEVAVEMARKLIELAQRLPD